MTAAGTYVVIIGHAVGNPEDGYCISYDWDGRQFADKTAAVSHGFEIAESDDFNIGVVRNGKLVSLWWMDKNLNEGVLELAGISDEIGLT